MLAPLADHLWQSLLFCALAALLGPCARAELSLVRPWLWRACVLKFCVPFSLLFAAGKWVGFPVAQAGDTVPEPLARAAAAWSQWLSPLQSAGTSAGDAAWCVLVLAMPAVMCVRLAQQALRRERPPTFLEEGPPTIRRRVRLAFLLLRSTLLSTCAILVIALPLLGGAIADRTWRQALLLENVRALRDAPVRMNIAAPGMGQRSRIEARADGVLIRNVDIQELIAVSNGVSRYAIFTDQMYVNEPGRGVSAWMLEPRFDVELRAPIREPAEFDPYALRQRITRLLVERFGVEIHINGVCQPPCGRWDTRRDERPL